MNSHAAAAVLALLATVAPASWAQPDRPLKDGDRILVKIWADTVFADTARVQYRGVVVLPRIGPVSVSEVPASRVADSVRSVYSRLFHSLTVEVSPLRKVTVIGEVKTPNVFFLDPAATVRDAMAMAGGVTEIGKATRLTRIRDSVATSISNWYLLRGIDAAVYSGDVLIVEREAWLKRNAFTVVSGVGVLLSIALTLSQL